MPYCYKCKYFALKTVKASLLQRRTELDPMPELPIVYTGFRGWGGGPESKGDTFCH